MLDAAHWTNRLTDLADRIAYLFASGRLTPRIG
jgi:hypothetical protein